MSARGSAALKGNKRAVGNKGGGRLPTYKNEYAEMARRICLLKATTDAEMAEIFDVSETTIYAWKNEYPEFAEAQRLGKLHADANVAASLYHRATGYSHEAVRIFPKGGGKGKKKDKPLLVPYTEHYPPDTAAAKHWLNNRQPAYWRERIEHAGEITIPVRFIVEGGPGTIDMPPIRQIEEK